MHLEEAYSPLDAGAAISPCRALVDAGSRGCLLYVTASAGRRRVSTCPPQCSFTKLGSNNSFLIKVYACICSHAMCCACRVSDIMLFTGERPFLL